MEIILWIIGVPLALFILYRIFLTFSIFGRGIFLGVIAGYIFHLLNLNIWIGAGCGFIFGIIILPIVLDLFGIDYEFMERKAQCPMCGSHRLKKTTGTDSNGNGDYDVVLGYKCRKCGHYHEIRC